MTILITGASRGIGAGLALELAEEGHNLLLLSRSETELRKVADRCNAVAGKTVAIPVVYDLKEILKDGQGLYTQLKSVTDTIHVLVNNAGHLVRKPFMEISLEEAREAFDVNYFAPAELIRLCLPLLERAEEASVVNVTSMSAVQGAAKFPGLSAYGASKAALATLTESLAEEYRKQNIRFNALAFGAVQTEMLAEAFPGYEASTSVKEMASFFKWFVLEGWKRFNGKMLPVSDSTP